MKRILLQAFCLTFGISECALLGQEGTIPKNLRVMQEMFASATASSTGSGTLQSPISLDQALSKATANSIITLLPGTYPSLTIRKSGLIVRSSEKWGARIVGSPGLHGVTVATGVTNVVIDGLEVSKSYIDGVKLNGGGNTVRNCWIHDSGRGNPNAQTNTDASFTGQGVYAGCYENNTIEFNLIESNGVWNGHDHGIYISGTNTVIRGNVLRNNWAYGLQIYTEGAGKSCSGMRVYNNLIYGNGVYNGGVNCVTVWAGPPGVNTGTTNFFYNNTMASKKYYPIICVGGYVALTNNMLLGSYGGSIAAEDGAVVWCDYNLFTNAVSSATGIINGGHNVRTSNPGLVNPAVGLHWLTSGSPARNAGYPLAKVPVDFFGRQSTRTTDIGAFAFDSSLAADTRVLDPSSDPDYWRMP